MDLMEIWIWEIKAFCWNLQFIKWFVDCNFFDTYNYEKLLVGYKTKQANKNKLQERLPEFIKKKELKADKCNGGC